MKRRHRRWAGLAAAFVAVTSTSSGAVPLYDGIGFPDEPYRYVVVPAGVKHGPPPKAQVAVTSRVVHGANQDRLDVASDEQGPQVLLVLPDGALHAGLAATAITVTLSPHPPDTRTADGPIDGNVYRVTVTAQPDLPVTYAGGNGPSLVYLRAATTAPAPPVMEHRAAPASPWAVLPTTRSGQDVFLASYAGAGEYALVHQRGARAAVGASQETLLLALLGGFVALVIIALALSRRQVNRNRDDEAGSP